MSANAPDIRHKLIFVATVAVAIAAGVGLRWKSLTGGFGSDDYTQYAMLKGAYPVERSPFDLFDFADGSAQETQKLMDFGAVPWWTHPNLRLAMMRPLSSALIVLDHAVFGSNLVGFHVHTMLWWAILVICVALVLRELLPRQMVAVAVLLFAIEEGHGLPVAWLANRSALVSLSLGLVGLWGHIRWRRRGHKPALILSIVMFSLALLAGEWTFPVFAYLFAFELLGVKGSLVSRGRALLPAGILSVVFLVLQHELQYSALKSNVYINPVSEPLVFLWEASRRIPVFFAELVFSVPAYWWHTGTPWRSVVLGWNVFTPEVWKRLPDWEFWHFLIGVAAGVIGYHLIRWGLRNCTEEIRREFRWLLLGSLLALIPMVASFPSCRLVVPAFIGISAAWAMVALQAVRHLGKPTRLALDRRQTLALAVLAGMAWCQVWHASWRSAAEVGARAYFHKSVREWLLKSDIDDKKAVDQDIFLVNGIEHTVVVFPAFVRFFHGHPLPRSCRVLSAAPRAHDIRRTDRNTLEISVLGGSLLTSDLEKLYRADRFPLRVGDIVTSSGLKVEILKLLRGKPFQLRFTFDKPLEDPSYLFLHSSSKGLRRFKIPKIGKRLRLPKAQFPDYGLLQYWKSVKRARLQDRRRRARRSAWNWTATPVIPSPDAGALPPRDASVWETDAGADQDGAQEAGADESAVPDAGADQNAAQKARAGQSAVPGADNTRRDQGARSNAGASTGSGR